MKVETVQSILDDITRAPGLARVQTVKEGEVLVYIIEVERASVGRVIGKNGQAVKALRALLRTSDPNDGGRASVRIKEV